MLSFFTSNTSFLYACVCITLSIISFQFHKEKLSLVLLFAGSLVLGLFIAKLDPFINLWDEQFHALVAKNFLHNPFKPVLIEEPVFGFTNLQWSYCKVWLHKQPLFLWQIALSIKLFGLNEVAIRAPSVLMHAFMIFFIYRSAKIIISHNVGYYAALFFTCAYFPLEYLTGFYATDHNDISFLFYCFASIWALIEYTTSKRKVYLVLIGAFAGCAILCKWLIGLLVYAIWSVLILKNYKTIKPKKEILNLFLSLLFCVIIFLPWQLYTYLKFPLEYAYEMDFNSKHIFEPLEGHGGGFLFYYDALYEQYGEGLLIPPLILITYAYMLKCIKDTNYKLILFLIPTIPYVFFTFVATKMYGYVFIAFPVFIMGLAFAFNKVIIKLQTLVNKPIFKVLINTGFILVVLIFLFNAGKIYKHHSEKEHGRYLSRLTDIREKQLYTAIKKAYGNSKCLLFNCNTSLQSHILAIYYTEYPCFNFILNAEQIFKAKEEKYELIAIDDGKLPENIIADKSIIKVKF